MSGLYRIGDICVGQNFIYDTQHNGMECTILEEATYKLTRHKLDPNLSGEYSFVYYVQWEDGTECNVKENKLKPKRPDDGINGLKRILDMFIKGDTSLVEHERKKIGETV